jgi:NAD(P)-dependent dehydrogenase (short-subunit alcohol dehydrogenase family)
MDSGDGRLTGRVAIVTGAGSVGEGFGTGKAISVLFARAGARVVLVDRDASRADDTRCLIEEEGGEAAIVVADIAEPSSWERIVDTVVDRFGTVDVLVNNAALANTIGILDTDLDDLQAIIAVNLVAPFMLSKAVIPVMVRGGGGVDHLHLVGGGAARAGWCRSHRVRGDEIRSERNDRRSGRRVRSQRDPSEYDRSRPHHHAAPGAAPRRPGSRRSELPSRGQTCLGIEGESWDVAHAALFLASPEGQYLTGVVLPVDGGSIARSH